MTRRVCKTVIIDLPLNSITWFDLWMNELQDGSFHQKKSKHLSTVEGKSLWDRNKCPDALLYLSCSTSIKFPFGFLFELYPVSMCSNGGENLFCYCCLYSGSTVIWKNTDFCFRTKLRKSNKRFVLFSESIRTITRTNLHQIPMRLDVNAIARAPMSKYAFRGKITDHILETNWESSKGI